MNNGLYNGLDSGVHNGLYGGLDIGVMSGMFDNETTKKKEIIKNGLIMYYDVPTSFSYKGGNIIYDLSIRSVNGTLLNGVGYRTTKGGALYFDGVNDYVSSTIPTLTTYSISMWVYSFNVTGTVFYILGTSNTAQGFYYGGGAVGGVYGFFDGTTGLNINGGAGNQAVINTWKYLTFTAKRGITGNYDYHFYDGVRLIGEIDYSASSLPINLINIGRRSDGNWYTNCLVPQLTVYNRCLNLDEITSNYNFAKNRYVG